MTKETIEKVKTLLRLVLDTEGTVENIRQTVTKSLPITLRQIFDQLDWIKRGFLTSSEFHRYFDDYPTETEQMKHGGEKAFQAMMEGMIRRFNKDKLNGRVSLPEFIDELTPKTQKQY